MIQYHMISLFVEMNTSFGPVRLWIGPSIWPTTIVVSFQYPKVMVDNTNLCFLPIWQYLVKM